ncbi:hypothetical protein KAR48_02755 [bacterium]|nr:hypothetical protein [bacterium]
MHSSKVRLSMFVILFAFTFVFGQSRDIIGYYPSWAYADRDGKIAAAHLAYDKVTIINYAFFLPTEQGLLIGKDAEADSVLLVGVLDNETGRRDPHTSLIALAHAHKVEVMLSIGGWADSSIFPSVAADSMKTARFAGECVRCIRQYGFDGIDIDWEYPGYSPHRGSPVDRVNFTAFLQAVRKSLDDYTKITGVYYPLSAALSASPSRAVDMEMGKIAEILDFVNLMTYDYHGSWDSSSNHNSPLYPTAGGEPQSCFDSTFKLYNGVYQIPAEKINMGVAFYSHSFGSCDSLYGASIGSGRAALPEGGDYQSLMKQVSSFTRLWDDKAQVPYLLHEEKRVLVSYDDVRSISLKAEYVKTHGARGLIIWEMTGDMCDDGTTPLLDAINSTFEKF